MQDLSLNQCELMTIRYLCQLAEKLANGAQFGYVASGRRNDVLNQISRLADRSEHVAQYALECLEEGMRVNFIQDDLKVIELTLKDFAQELSHIGAAPSSADIRRISEALAAVAET